MNAGLVQRIFILGYIVGVSQPKIFSLSLPKGPRVPSPCHLARDLARWPAGPGREKNICFFAAPGGKIRPYKKLMRLSLCFAAKKGIPPKTSNSFKNILAFPACISTISLPSTSQKKTLKLGRLTSKTGVAKYTSFPFAKPVFLGR